MEGSGPCQPDELTLLLGRVAAALGGIGAATGVRHLLGKRSAHTCRQHGLARGWPRSLPRGTLPCRALPRGGLACGLARGRFAGGGLSRCCLLAGGLARGLLLRRTSSGCLLPCGHCALLMKVCCDRMGYWRASIP